MACLSDVLESIGWRWKMALVLLLMAPASWALPGPATPWPTLVLLAGAALLALGSTLALLEQALASGSENASGNMAALGSIVEEQRLRTHEAAAALGRAVTAGAQLVSLARDAEQRWRDRLEQGVAQNSPSSVALLEAVRSSMAAAQEATEASLQRHYERMEARHEAWAAAQAAAAMPADLPGHLGRLESVSHCLTLQAQGQARHEASLGDAARYMTETADRLRNGVQAVETQAVRLHALLMAQRAAEAGPSPLPEGRALQERPSGAPLPDDMVPLLRRLQDRVPSRPGQSSDF